MLNHRKKYKFTSLRQIRRQAKQETEEAFQECMKLATACSNVVDDEGASMSVKNITVEETLEISDLETIASGNVLDDEEASTSVKITNFEENLETLLLEDNDNGNIQLMRDNDTSETMSNNEDTDDINPDEENTSFEEELDYRYSDSEAESIPDFDEDDVASMDVEELNKLHMNEKQRRDNDFKNDVTQWSLRYSINHTALQNLLQLLNKHTETNFPKDPRTLLKTPTCSNVIDMDTGHYCHLGLEDVTTKIIKSRIQRSNNFNTVNLFINIDGAPITGKSSEKGLWTILCKDYDCQTVHVVGIYHGTKKSQDSNVFLKQFVEDAKSLIHTGLVVDRKKYKIKIYGFNLDSPAKSFVLCTKYPSGYSSCSKCEIEGDYFNCVCFPLPDKDSLLNYCNTRLRTDDCFKNMRYLHEYQRTICILNEIPELGLVSNVPIDSMHAVYLGIMRQLIRHWLGDKGRINKKYKLSLNQIKFVSDNLEKLKQVLPDDFNRRCRSLSYWKQWKATEFRHFLLYFGPFLLKNVLHRDVYCNFLKLHIIISILSNHKLVKDHTNIDYAETLIVEFIQTFQIIYGKENVTFNVHALLHVAKDAKKYGPLDQFSAFPFESYLCSIKKLIRKGEKPLQQISRRLSEYEHVRDEMKLQKENKEIKTEKEHFRNCSLTVEGDKQYKILIINSWKINIDDNQNNTVMLDDLSVIQVENIIIRRNKLYVIGRKYEMARDLFTIPGLQSSILGIQIVSALGNIQCLPFDKIASKVFKVASTIGIIAYPIIHTFL